MIYTDSNTNQNTLDIIKSINNFKRSLTSFIKEIVSPYVPNKYDNISDSELDNIIIKLLEKHPESDEDIFQGLESIFLEPNQQIMVDPYGEEDEDEDVYDFLMRVCDDFSHDIRR